MNTTVQNFYDTIKLLPASRDMGLTTDDLWQFAQACEAQSMTASFVITELLRNFAQLHAPEVVAA